MTFDQAKNLKVVLGAFEKLSGVQIKFFFIEHTEELRIFVLREKWMSNYVQIKFDKSELFCLGEAKGKTDAYIQIFGCKEGSFFISKYLAIPMNHHKLANSDWKHIEEMFQKRLSS